ncbi:MAG: YccF domain-containing protein [Hellea sp.]|nr:YccF domain-containing protein [Hellea sp.]MDG1666017.1 YccF domain-containing protein [Hellea sp.]|tara:strand:+ start:143 stop:604 length:462 start_codon:yes stop_codon:yes gene_type:complete
MALLGNIIWFILGGWLLFILYSISAIIFFPVFLPLFRIAVYAAFPFGKSVISKRKLDKYRELNGNDTENSAMTTVAGFLNVLWIITFGWILALSHLLASIANLFLFFLIITIPNITGHWKMIRIAFMPFNTVIIPKNLANEIDTALAKGKFNL